MDVQKALELDVYRELVRHADMLANLWTAFRLAAERGDDACLKYHWDQIRAYCKAVSPLVGEIGRKDAANG